MGLPISLSSLSAVGAAGFVSGAGLLIAIGAQNAFVLRQGLQRRHVALVVAVCALSDMALILSGVAGMGLLVRQWPDPGSGVDKHLGYAFQWYALAVLVAGLWIRFVLFRTRKAGR